MEIAFTGVLAALFGSFLNVVVYRLPRQESVVKPRSHCTSCGEPVQPYDNIPIISWLVLRGHCRFCSAPISPRYPMVEGLTVALCVAAVLVHDSASQIALSIALILVVLPAALIDLEHRIIPNKLNAIGALLAILLGVVLDPSGEPERLLAAAGAGGFLLAALLAYPKGMGMGDVKFVAVIGLFLGENVIVAVLLALIAGVLVGGLVMARKGVTQGRKTAVPFGPFLALGAISAVFVGSPLITWYANTFIH